MNLRLQPARGRDRGATKLGRWIGKLTLISALAIATQASALAQGRVTGQVVDAELGEPLNGALVELVSGTATIVGSAITDERGNYTIEGVPPGSYSLLVSTLGYKTQRIDGINVGPGTTTVPAIELVSRAFELNPIVVTASRGQEKALDAPAAVVTVDAEQIRDAQPTTTVEYVRAKRGVDVWTYGIQQHNMVARGFNNVFSGALYVLTDNRWASVPSLRLNAYNLIPLTNDDLERIEMVLGPGSALYGPNVDNGVMHMITSSPLDKQETVLSITGGPRTGNSLGGTEGVFMGTLRHSGVVGDHTGYKISASYLNGEDWVNFDEVEVAARAAAIAGGDTATLIGARDFKSERLTADARIDFRAGEDGRFTIAGGTAGLLSSIELTGIGGAQAQDWFYSYVQARFNKGRFFAQAYTNFSSSGDSFLLRDGRLVSDNSKLYVGQLQHGTTIWDGRQNFTYGADVIHTRPDTKGTIHGQNENNDNIWEYGGYLQSETALSPQFDLVLAGRVDYHDFTEQTVFSPRAALVFKPTQGHSLRATYNRAFSQPTSVNLFIDLPSSARGNPLAGGTPFGVHASGVPLDGYTYDRDAMGVPLMRSFWAGFGLVPGVMESDPLPLDATLLWPLATELLFQNSGGAIDIRAIPQPTAAQVSTQLRALNTTDRTFGDVAVSTVQDVRKLEATTTTTFEAGYKGLISDRLLLGVDGYYSEIENFTSPLRVETPTVFYDPATLASYLGNFMPAAQAAQIAAVMAGISGSSDPTTRGIALATVAPSNTQASNPADILLTYRQFGKIDLWGVDVGAQFLVSDAVSLFGSYSYVSDDLFPLLEGVGDIALNAPKHKGSAGIEYRSERYGLSVGLRGRYVDSFPVNSGVYVGMVESYGVADLNIAYALPFHRNAVFSITGTNILDNKHIEVVGAPEIGAMWLARLRYVLP